MENKTFLTTVFSWGTTTVVGVFSSKDKAFSIAKQYLLNKSESMSEDEILTPYNEEINSSGVSSWDISNSDDVLVIRPIEVDVPLINVN